MNLFNWMSRMPRFAAALLMLLGLGAPANAGGWVVDHYEYSGSTHYGNLDGGVTITERDGKVLAENGHELDKSNRGCTLRTFINHGSSHPNQADHGKTASASLDSSVTAVLKWNRGTTYNVETGQDEVDTQDNPGTLYVRETATAYGGKEISGNNGNAINEMWTPDHPWRGEYYKISGSLGAYDNGYVETDLSYAGVYYGPFSKSKIIRIDNPGDEVKIPSYSFHGQLSLDDGYEQNEHPDWDSSASLHFGYHVDIVDFSLIANVFGGSMTSGTPTDQQWVGYLKQDYRLNAPVCP